MSDPRSDYDFTLPDDPSQRDRLAAIGQIASSLVHEIKNPLGAISLNVEMLQQQCADKNLDTHKTEKRLQRIADSTRNLHGIINSFLSYARPNRPAKDRIDVNQLLSDLIEEEKDVFEHLNIEISFKTDSELPAVPADRQQLRSIFFNIIHNACEALKERSDDQDDRRKLIIVTRSGSNSSRIMIANNGPPLNENAAAHLFDPFYSSKDNGTGLGLAIVQNLIELHQGKVHVSSNPSQGVSFTLEFPTTLGPAKSRHELPVPTIETEVLDIHTIKE
ncbi:MAG: GHKL domain-containing protein [Planctomycetes bacterium]|nr:GHKL domain-containing protein [Planctomycetota bacterium]